MSLAWLAAALLIVPATWVAALALAVRTVGRSSLTARLAGGPRYDLAVWFVDHVEATEVSLGFVRTLLRIAIVGAVVVAVSVDPADSIALGGETPVVVAPEAEATPPAAAGDETVEPATEAATEPTTGPAIEGFLLSPRSLLLAFVVSAALVWFTTVVIATAIARNAGEALVARSLPWLRMLTLVLTPFSPVVNVTHESVRRLAGAGRLEVEAEAEAELLRSIEEQQRGGGLDPQSASMLENIVWFTQTDVGEVMTPRTDIDGIEYTDDLSEIRSLIDEHGHSRMPVYEDNLDHILGILYVKDLVPYLGADGSNFRLRPLLREPKFVPETKQVNELLQDFQRSEVHMAIVVDEYGGTAGIATIEDVLEEIVGEIQDEHDTDHEDLPTLDELEPGLVAVDGRFHLDDLNEALGLSLPDDEEFDTVAGFVLARLGRVPAVNETMVVEGARLTVLEATATVIERLQVEFGIRAAIEPPDSADADADADIDPDIDPDAAAPDDQVAAAGRSNGTVPPTDAGAAAPSRTTGD